MPFLVGRDSFGEVLFNPYNICLITDYRALCLVMMVLEGLKQSLRVVAHTRKYTYYLYKKYRTGMKRGLRNCSISFVIYRNRDLIQEN